MLNEFKVCKSCLATYPLEKFHKNKNRDGRFNICKICHHKRVAAWRAKNRDKTPSYSRTSGLRHRYGITPEKFEEMVKSQNNKCLICGETPSNTKAFQTWKLHIDHCHKTKKIRGLLCHLCNRGLGLFKERSDLLEKALLYLKFHS